MKRNCRRRPSIELNVPNYIAFKRFYRALVTLPKISVPNNNNVVRHAYLGSKHTDECIIKAKVIMSLSAFPFKPLAIKKPSDKNLMA